MKRLSVSRDSYLVPALLLIGIFTMSCDRQAEPPTAAEPTPLVANDTAQASGQTPSPEASASPSDPASGLGNLEGVVRDAQGQAIRQASLFFPELSKGAVTIEDGRFVINGIPAGSHQLTVSYIGSTKQVNVEIYPDSTAYMEIQLGE